MNTYPNGSQKPSGFCAPSAVSNAIFRDDGRIDEAAGEKAATTIEKL